MSPAVPAPVPYRVAYSERVRQRLLALADNARQRGDGEAFLAALKESHRRLSLYPQIGEPVIDLTQETGQVWVGIVRPLALRSTSPAMAQTRAAPAGIERLLSIPGAAQHNPNH